MENVSRRKILGVILAVTLAVQVLTPITFVKSALAEEVTSESTEVSQNAEVTDPSEPTIEEETVVEESQEEETSQEGEVVSVWTQNSDGSYTTTENVTEQNYIFPEDEQIKINFTKVSEEGTMTVKKIALDAQEKEDINSALDFAVEITSTMSNGSFKYDLTLPGADSSEAEIKYASSFSANVDDYQDVEGESVSSDKIVARGLNHFTVFYVWASFDSYTDADRYIQFNDPIDGDFYSEDPLVIDIEVEARYFIDPNMDLESLTIRYADLVNGESCQSVYDAAIVDDSYNMMGRYTLDGSGDVGNITRNGDIYNFTDVDLSGLGESDYGFCAFMERNDNAGGSEGFLIDNTAAIGIEIIFDTYDASISGMKYWDTNADGTYNDIDSGLEDWPIDLYDTDGNYLETVYTDVNGDYSFTGLPAGQYIVCEALNPAEYAPLEWNQTQPGGDSCYGGPLGIGTSVENIDFGNAMESMIFGFKFEDLNGNALWDFNESGLGGWTIELYDATGTVLLDTYVTDSDGFFWFMNLEPGTYVVREVMQDGWEATDAEEYTVVIPDYDIANWGYVEIGNREIRIPGTIYGTKYHDRNMNGQMDNDEEVLEGWEFTLIDANSGQVIDATTSDTNGYYEFTDIYPGDYYVVEGYVSGWYVTNPTDGYYLITVNEEGSYEANFGNYQDLMPDIDIDQDDMSANPGDIVNLTSTLVSEGNTPIQSVEWTSSNGVSGSGMYLDTGSLAAGTYTFSVRVTDFDGDMDEDTITITVASNDPTPTPTPVDPSDPADPTLIQTGDDMLLSVKIGLLLMAALFVVQVDFKKVKKALMTINAKA